jgi:hypothetical protein
MSRRGWWCLALWIGVAVGVGAGSPARGQASPFPRDLVEWVADPAGPVFAGTDGPTWDRKIRERGWIVREGETFHLFYTGYNDERAPGRFLGHATSPDGVRWSRDPANPLTRDGWVEDVCLARVPGGFWMIAEGEGDIAHRLTSTDLLRWTERGPLDIRRADGTPIAPGPRGTPFAFRKGDRWLLLYERRDEGVWLAASPDGEIWTNVRDEPVLARGPEAYDLGAVALNQVIERDGWYYAYYHANVTRPWKDWSTCVARSRDLIAWEKYPGNPILRENKSSAVLVEGTGGELWLYTMHPAVVRHRNPPPARPSGTARDVSQKALRGGGGNASQATR